MTLAFIFSCVDDPIVPAIDPWVAFEMRKEDERECEVITQFLTDGCKCATNCSTKFTRHYYEYLRCHCAELTHEVLDMVIMGQLMAFARPENKIFQYLHIGEKVKLIIVYIACTQCNVTVLV